LHKETVEALRVHARQGCEHLRRCGKDVDLRLAAVDGQIGKGALDHEFRNAEHQPELPGVLERRAARPVDHARGAIVGGFVERGSVL
jgi:hypothetical protein